MFDPTELNRVQTLCREIYRTNGEGRATASSIDYNRFGSETCTFRSSSIIVTNDVVVTSIEKCADAVQAGGNEVWIELLYLQSIDPPDDGVRVVGKQSDRDHERGDGASWPRDRERSKTAIERSGASVDEAFVAVLAPGRPSGRLTGHHSWRHHAAPRRRTPLL